MTYAGSPASARPRVTLRKRARQCANALGRVSRRNMAENEKKNGESARFSVDPRRGSHHKVFTHGVSCVHPKTRKKTTSFVSSRGATVSKTRRFQRRIRSNATDQTPKFRSSLHFIFRFWKRVRFTCAFRARRVCETCAFVKRARRRRTSHRKRTAHHALAREKALMTPVLSTRNVSLTLILTSKRSNA